MSNRDSYLLFENYTKVYNSNRIFNDLYKRDIQAIESLLIEAGFFKNLGQNIGNKFNNLKQTAQNVYSTGANLAQNIKQGYQAGAGGNNEVATLVNTIIGNIFKKKEDFVKGIQMIASGKVDQEGIKTLQTALSKPTQNNESNKQFLARTVFTESNLAKAFKSNSLLISEMMSVGGANTGGDVSGQLDKLAQEMAAKIQKLYPDKQAMMNSIPVFNNKVSQYLGSESQVQPPAAASPAGAATGAPQSPQGAQGQDQGVQGQTQEAQGQEQAGLLQKITEFAQSHPKMSIGAGVAALGILAAGVSTVGVAGLVTGAIISALKGAGISTIVEVAKQMIKNKSFNLQGLDMQQIKSRAGLGALFGGLGGVLSTGLGAIGSSLSSIVKGTHSDVSNSAIAGQAPNAPTQQNMGNNPPAQQNAGNPIQSYGSTTKNYLSYQRDIAKALNMNPANFDLKQGIPYDVNGNRLPIDDDTLDKLAAKNHQGAVMTSSAKAAAVARGKIPVKPGSMMDF